MAVVSVSSFSLWEQLGGLRIPVTDPSGARSAIVIERPTTLSLLDFPALAKSAFSVDHVEICQIQMVDSSDAAVEDLRLALDRAGVRLVNMPIDIGDVADPDDAARDADLVEIERWISIAGRLGARFCRVRVGFDARDEAAYHRAARSLSRLADFAHSLGLQLLVENQGDLSANPDVLIRLCDQMGDGRLGLLLDTGNFEPVMSVSNAKTSGQPLPDVPLDVEPIYRAITLLAPYAKLVHAKSHEFTPSGEHTPMDLSRALKIVRSTGFSGPVSVEYEGMSGDRVVNTARTVATVRDVFG